MISSYCPRRSFLSLLNTNAHKPPPHPPNADTARAATAAAQAGQPALFVIPAGSFPLSYVIVPLPPLAGRTVTVIRETRIRGGGAVLAAAAEVGTAVAVGALVAGAVLQELARTR